jgi:hypothetical protein
MNCGTTYNESLLCKNQTGHRWDLGGFGNRHMEGISGKRYMLTSPPIVGENSPSIWELNLKTGFPASILNKISRAADNRSKR